MWVLGVLIVVLVVGIVLYNGLVKLREQGDAAWADIDVQLKRRHDLVPNLVETVKGYAGHEKQTLESVIEARTHAMAAQGPADQAEAEGTLQGALHSLFALAEGYPELKAAEGFRNLQSSLAEIEDHVAKARRYYNAVIRDYNTKVGQVPSNLVARGFGFHEREFFEIAGQERVVPRVSLEAGAEEAGPTPQEG